MKNPHAVALGSKGGKSKSAKKKAAARENGKNGGRPSHGGHTLRIAGCAKCVAYWQV